ncbi:MAG: acyltransferase [Oscillatoriophycideae cyanobacterium NC_groundwater_1537_Pr4_S-0.65um_50_18]|nr:acyltransferase [Oscillatoriophycideae cyanobacterium NC_groundwater_1537_Pr4_S-0.65um_50_18]
MALGSNLQRVLLELLSDLEFKLTNPSHSKVQKWRKRYLKFMQIGFKNQFYMGQDIYIRNRGNLTLGDRCSLGSFTRIWNYAPIKIGDDFMSAGNLTLNSGTHDPIDLQPKGSEINIGSRVWCGVNVTIIAGITVGDDVVIGAGSLVINDIPSGCVVAGVPAKKIRDIDRTGIQIWQPFATTN